MPLWRGKNKFTYLELTPSGVLQGLGYRPKGNYFYVDGNSGSDTSVSQGKAPATPFKTIAHALDQCTSGNHDYIVVLNHYQETFPITVDVNSVHIVAINTGQPMVWLTASSDTAIFNIEADFVEIAGFEFGAGASHAAIEFTATKGYGRIHDCVFGWMQTGQDGIKVVAPYEAAETVIENCLFGPSLTRDGIRVDQAMTRGLIQNNIFQAPAGVCINIVSAAHYAVIRDNVFNLPSDTEGKAITLGSNNAHLYIANNNCNFGSADSMGTQPYKDGASADANTWDNNKTAGVVDYPA
jgi:hypothetical protein